MGRIVLKLLLQLLALCLVTAAGCWLLDKFVWWLVRNDYDGLFIKACAIFYAACFALFFFHFSLHDGKLLFKDKEEEQL